MNLQTRKPPLRLWSTPAVCSVAPGLRQAARLSCLALCSLLILSLICRPVPAGFQDGKSRLTPPSYAASGTNRPQDEIWLVSARHVGCLRGGDTPQLEIQRYVAETGWIDADVNTLLQPTTPDQMLLMYVHGNRVESYQAAREGRAAYSLVTAGFNDPVSIRYVIWSWPSAQIHGQLHDVRVKAQRTELGGYCLGWFLAQLPEHQRVGLMGYSFGARIVSGGLHLLGGGQLAGRVLPSHHASGPQTRVVLLAAAMHRNWLRPGCYHKMALSHIDFLLNLYNTCDPVLKRYRFLYKHSRPAALGFGGMYTGDLGEKRVHISQINTCQSVQKSHAAIGYFQNGRLKARMQQVLFWRPLSTADNEL